MGFLSFLLWIFHERKWRLYIEVHVKNVGVYTQNSKKIVKPQTLNSSYLRKNIEGEKYLSL